MRKVVLFIATSLDGYIADFKGSVNWIQGEDAENNDMGNYNKFIKTIDTVVLGRRTYEQIITELSPDVWPYKGLDSYVLTHREYQNNQEERIFFVNTDIKKFIEELKSEEGKKDIWICGGANIINQLVELDLIDKYYLTVVPTILGDGIRLFDKIDKNINLKLVETSTYNGMIDLIYERR